MYITKYWGDFIGGSDDSLSLVEFLEDLNKEEITLKGIFTGIGLDRQNMDFRQTVENLGFINSTGLEIDFYYVIDVVTDLAAILLECKINGHVNLRDLDDNEDAKNRCIRVVATEEEYTGIKAALEDFVKDPKSYDLYEMIGDDIIEMAEIVKELRKDLLQCYENKEFTEIKLKGIDVIYKQHILTLTRFWGDNRLCLFAKNSSQINIPKMEFVGGYPNEWCIFIDNLTEDEKTEIKDTNGRHISLQEIGI